MLPISSYPISWNTGWQDIPFISHQNLIHPIEPVNTTPCSDQSAVIFHQSWFIPDLVSQISWFWLANFLSWLKPCFLVASSPRTLKIKVRGFGVMHPDLYLYYSINIISSLFWLLKPIYVACLDPNCSQFFMVELGQIFIQPSSRWKNVSVVRFPTVYTLSEGIWSTKVGYLLSCSDRCSSPVLSCSSSQSHMFHVWECLSIPYMEHMGNEKRMRSHGNSGVNITYWEHN